MDWPKKAILHESILEARLALWQLGYFFQSLLKPALVTIFSIGRFGNDTLSELAQRDHSREGWKAS